MYSQVADAQIRHTDEMGLGKTIQAAAFMVCARREFLTPKPFLVIAPKSTLSGWEQVLQVFLVVGF